MRPAAACVLAMAVFGLIMGVVGCEQMPTGPSLTNIVLSGFTKQATLEPPDNSLCCCRAIGSVTNRNTVPVYVSVTLTAVDTRGQNLSSVLAPVLGAILSTYIGIGGALVVSALLRLCGFALFAWSARMRQVTRVVRAQLQSGAAGK